MELVLLGEGKWLFTPQLTYLQQATFTGPGQGTQEFEIKVESGTVDGPWGPTLTAAGREVRRSLSFS